MGRVSYLLVLALRGQLLWRLWLVEQTSPIHPGIRPRIRLEERKKKKTFSSLKKKKLIKVIKSVKDVDVQGEVCISRKET